VNSFWGTSVNRWIAAAFAFGVVPAIICLVFLHPPLIQISNYRNHVQLQIAGSMMGSLGPAPATNQELEQLEKIKQDRLARIKKIGNRESLLRFSNALTDALASQARAHGLHVISADLQNPLIRGKYVPANERAIDILTALPGPEWNELSVPLDLPMLHLPSIEIQMDVEGEYSQVFSFIESLPDFPAQVNLTGMGLSQGQDERAFQLKIRGYYYDANTSEPWVIAQNAESH
jgi:hypothetical protein